MGYLIKAILGMALFIGGTVLFNVKLMELLEVGTCASGNQPFVVARECPEGTGTDVLLMSAAIIGGLIGAALFAFRGNPPWGRGGKLIGGFSWGTFAWGIFFAGSGAVILISSLNSDLPADSELGGIIVGITFLVMGVPALLWALYVIVTGLGDRDERPSSSRGAATGGGISMPSLANAARGLSWGSGSSSARSGGGGDDAIAKLERLQKLRDSGALTETEFEREKAKVLSES